MENVIKNKNIWFPKKTIQVTKKYGGKIVLLKKIYKFTSDYFTIGHVVFVLNVKNVPSHAPQRNRTILWIGQKSKTEKSAFYPSSDYIQRPRNGHKKKNSTKKYNIL